VQVEIPVSTPILRLTIFVLSDTLQVTDVDTTNLSFNTSLNDVFGETVEEVGSTLRPFMMESRGLVAPRVVALGNLLREVVPVLFQPIAGVQVGIFGAVRNGGKVADAEVDSSRFSTGGGGRLDFVFTDEMYLSPFF
jgi:hypothetical protein